MFNREVGKVLSIILFFYVCLSFLAVAAGAFFGGAYAIDRHAPPNWADLYNIPAKKIFPIYGLAFMLSFWFLGGFSKKR